MKEDETEEKPGYSNLEDHSRSAVNTTILNYYKKFGRKRDLERYFSLSTAQSDIRDPSGLFWGRMKAQDSSDSSGKKSESSTEVCRISIKCSVPEASGSKETTFKSAQHESDSPPIVTEDAEEKEHTDDDSVNSDNHSQKSIDATLDATLDTSTNKPLSPTSSVTSHKKLEWDSLADVGYANESDRKTSSSGLSTVERLALKQHFSDNEIEIGTPTAHSTMVESKGKSRKRLTELHSKDVDVVELNMPRSEATPSINVNLTKHISFNVEKDGGITLDKKVKNVSVSPAKVSVETEVTPKVQLDKEIQTSLVKSDDAKHKKSSRSSSNGAPVFISLNTLRKRIRKRRRKKSQSKKRAETPKNISVVEKSGEVLSDAESFEYMPGHVYNQNQRQKLSNSAGNKSSLESSGGITTGSSNISFAQDLERSIDMLQKILKQNQEDSNVKKQLIKDLVKKFVTTRYKDDTSTEFLSGLSASSKRIGRQDYKSTTTSTSDANISEPQVVRPKKSILRTNKFNANELASTSQSAPNLATVSKIEPPFTTNFDNSKTTSSHTESDVSSKDTKSSQELYNKYLDALRREAYKKHLRNKEKLLKEKLVGSDGAIRQLVQTDARSKRLEELMKDLTRNNYNDGSGDASKLEGGSHSDKDNTSIRKQRSHSVFTLSSNNSEKKDDNDKERRKIDLRNRLQEEIESRLSTKDRPIKHHYCCCPHHTPRPNDSFVQTDTTQVHKNDILREPHPYTKNMTDIVACGQYVSCVCSGKGLVHNLEKCGCKCTTNSSHMTSKSENIAQCVSKETNTSPVRPRDFAQPSTSRIREVEVRHVIPNECKHKTSYGQKTNQSSQTNVAVNVHRPRSSDKYAQITSSTDSPRIRNEGDSHRDPICIIQESTRWTQTELSILPRVAEATLSDFKIVSDDNCAKLVSQTYREVKISKPKNRGIDTADDSEDLMKDNENNNKAKPNYQYKTKDIAIQSNLDLSENVKGNGDNYAIPLRGTNMTLLVSVGSNVASGLTEDVNRNETNPNQLDDGIETRVLREKSTNAIQCQTDDMHVHGNNYNASEVNSDRNKISFCNPLKVANPCLSGSNKFSTYPKEQKKVMLRSNTDGMLSEKCNKEQSLRICREISPERKTRSELTNPRTNKMKARDNITDIKSAKSCLNSNSSKSENSGNSKNSISKCSISGSPLNKDRDIMSSNEINETAESSLKSDSSKSARSNNSNKTKLILTEEPTNDKQLNKCKNNKQVCGEGCDCGCRDENPKYEAIEAVENKKSMQSNTKRVEASELKNNPNKTTKDKAKTKSNNDAHKCGEGCDCGCKEKDVKDPALEMIRDITRRYSKQELEKGKRKKCFKEIMAVLNYLLDTDDSTDGDCAKRSGSTDNELEVKSDKIIPKKVSPDKNNRKEKVTVCTATSPKRLVDKGVQLFQRKSRSKTAICESSDHPDSSDMPTTSSDSVTCQILNKIKKECEKYHQKRCKCSNHRCGGSKRCEGSSKRCEGSSTTSVSCEDCKKVHYCYCRAHNPHKCKHRTKQEKEKKCVAYNLIIQTSDSFVGEETCDKKRQLKNIVFKVPPKKQYSNQNIPFKEMASKIEEYANSKRCAQTQYKFQRSKSLPNESEISSADDVLKRCPTLTVRDYLEKNRPDFIENTSTRQNCLKMISECRADERAAQRQLLSMQLRRGEAMNVSTGDLRRLAKEVGVEIRRRKVPAKLISEREMKQRSAVVYRALPEVRRRRDEARNENIKKTNLLMASIFKKIPRREFGFDLRVEGITAHGYPYSHPANCPLTPNF